MSYRKAARTQNYEVHYAGVHFCGKDPNNGLIIFTMYKALLNRNLVFILCLSRSSSLKSICSDSISPNFLINYQITLHIMTAIPLYGY